ncbi:alpha/beta fold hydrolase [Thalassorhabdomicrobium marinisediminis]|uniref:alpha/beta fold hydrolase n=1 Tax=Thalassorhabdomicrobium marinisediminis TaxID=2170577 RepID=UPI002490B9C9|nr:alpha/beta hydrolase [Thalassorhabdomicrobium marinisediminis]
MGGRLLKSLTLAALVGGVLFTARQSSEHVAAAERNFPPEGQYIEVDGRQIHAVVRGTGPDLVLIHGAGGNLRDFTFDLMDRLTDRYRVIAFDRPGMGYSDRAGNGYGDAFGRTAESPAEQAALLAAAARALGAERPIVLGHSYGASVALAWALDHPDNIAGLINLAGPSHPWPGELGAYYTVIGSSLGGLVVPPLVSAYASDGMIRGAVEGIFGPQEVPEGYVEHIGAPLTIRPDSLRANTRQVNTLRPHIVEMTKRYAQELALPVEIIHGDLDETVPLEIHSIPLRDALPQANLTVLEGIGHMPHHAAPDMVEAAIDRIADKAGLR